MLINILTMNYRKIILKLIQKFASTKIYKNLNNYQIFIFIIKSQILIILKIKKKFK